MISNIDNSAMAGQASPADGAMRPASNDAINNPSAQILNTPAENTPQNRVASPQQVAETISSSEQDYEEASTGRLVDVRA